VKVIIFYDTALYSNLSKLIALALEKILIFKLKRAGTANDPSLICISFHTVVGLGFVELFIYGKRSLFHKKIFNRLSKPSQGNFYAIVIE
jgi:hypothetical protein